MVTGLEAVWGFKAIGELLKLAKEAKDLTDSTAVQAKLASIYPLVLEAQMDAINANKAHAAEVDRIRELEAKIAGFENWNAEKERYELKAIGRGALAYMLKPEVRGTLPPHWLCANCYEKGEKAYLQAKASAGVSTACPRCNATVVPDRHQPIWLD